MPRNKKKRSICVLASLCLLILATAHALNATPKKTGDECQCYPHDNRGGKIAYLITLHNHRTLIDAHALFQSIVAPGNIVIIHIDKKLQWASYLSSRLKTMIENCNCGAQVHVDSVYDCVWGSWNMMDPLHWGTCNAISSESLSHVMSAFLSKILLPSHDIVDQQSYICRKMGCIYESISR